MTNNWKDGDCVHLCNCANGALISHVVGSSKHKHSVSWKKFWIDNACSKWPKYCQILGCSNSASVGAHVYVKHLHQNFILPTCQQCNKDPNQEYGVGWISCKKNAKIVQVKAHKGTFYWTR